MTGLSPLPTVTRIRHPEVVPLEFAELLPFDSAVWRELLSRGLALALVQFLQDLLTAGVKCSSIRDGAGAPLKVEAVFLSGGRLCDRKFRRRLRNARLPIVLCDDPVFGGELGGLALLESQHSQGWIADLGQSQLKISADGRRWTFARDFRRLRLASGVPRVAVPGYRQRLREFIALKLQSVESEINQPPGALIFALPARVAQDGTPSANSYAGMGGDRGLLPETLSLAGLDRTRLFVLNDAELSAHSARSDPRLAACRRVLVLTLGFGIGAALIQRG